MFQLVRRVNGTVLWANLDLLAAAIAFLILVRTITRAEGRDGPVNEALGRDVKGRISPVIYLVGIGSAFLSSWLALACCAVVAAIWLVPDRRMGAYVAAHDLDG